MGSRRRCCCRCSRIECVADIGVCLVGGVGARGCVVVVVVVVGGGARGQVVVLVMEGVDVEWQSGRRVVQLLHLQAVGVAAAAVYVGADARRVYGRVVERARVVVVVVACGVDCLRVVCNRCCCCYCCVAIAGATDATATTTTVKPSVAWLERRQSGRVHIGSIHASFSTFYSNAKHTHTHTNKQTNKQIN